MVGHQLNESLASTAQIVFFLMGAMTIVEVVDAHNGFEVITSRIRTTKLSTLIIGSQPIRTASMDTEPPSTPSTGKRIVSLSRRRAIT